MQCMCSVQHLEAEDVEQSDVTALAHAGRGDECRVDERHDLVEDARIQRRRERVTRARRLARRVGLAVGRLGARREELLVQAHARRLHAYAVHNYMHMHMHMHTQCTCSARAVHTQSTHSAHAVHTQRAWGTLLVEQSHRQRQSTAPEQRLELGLEIGRRAGLSLTTLRLPLRWWLR